MSWTDLEFEPQSATLDVFHEVNSLGPSVHMRLRYIGENPLVSAEGELLQYEYWGVMIYSSNSDDEEGGIETVGQAKRMGRNLISLSVEMPPERFKLLVNALLSDKPLEYVTIQTTELEDVGNGYMWHDPDNAPLSINNFLASFRLIRNSESVEGQI